MSDRESMAADIRHSLDKAQRDILASIDKLAQELPTGFVVSDVYVDAFDADMIGGRGQRVFSVAISVELRV